MSDARARRELFVWYRVDSALAESVRLEVERVQRVLEASCSGLQARLLVRVDANGAQTWMETYAMRADAAAVLDDALEARIASAFAALGERLASERHAERFELVERR